MVTRNQVSESTPSRSSKKDISKKPVKLGPDEASHDQIISALRSVAPPSQPLLDMLDIPEKLFVEGEWTFCSKPNSTIHGITYAIHSMLQLPDEIPDYGISLSNQGSNLFITFVDKKRQVIVYESVGHEQSIETASYDKFQSSLNMALGEAKALKASGEKFNFVIIQNGLAETIYS